MASALPSSTEKPHLGATDSPLIDSGDTAFLLFSTIMVLSMIPALGIFEAGMLRVKNTISLLSQVFAGLAVCSLLWFMIGYSLVFGKSEGKFIGSPKNGLFFNVGYHTVREGTNVPEVAFATFQMMFATICPLLMTGSFAERLRFKPFLVLVVLWSIIIYYPVAHWVWSDGFLAHLGALDFAGGIVIHTTAGVGSLVIAMMLGRRVDFYEKEGEYKPSNLPLAVTGAGMLWTGWFCFNGGSSLGSSGLTSVAVINTQVASAASAIVWMGISWYRHKVSIIDLMNGAIAGLAGVTPASGYIEPRAAVICGLLLGFVSYYSVEILRFVLHIDDALDVSSVHGMTGLFGSLFIGAAASKDVNPAVPHDGFALGGGGKMLYYQIVAVVVTIAWSGVWTYLIVKFVDRFVGRITHSVAEEEGLDVFDHGVEAYDLSPLPEQDGDTALLIPQSLNADHRSGSPTPGPGRQSPRLLSNRPDGDSPRGSPKQPRRESHSRLRNVPQNLWEEGASKSKRNSVDRTSAI